MVRTLDKAPFDAADQLAALGQAVITTDVAGVVVYWNPAAEALYGWTADEAVGRNIASLSVPDMAQEIAADVMAALRDGGPGLGRFPVRRKDGPGFPALVLRSDAVVTYASPAVEELFGWQEDDLVGSTIIPLLHEEDRRTLASFLERVVANPGAHPPVELRVRRDDSWVWAEAALTNLLDDPLVRGVVCNLRLSPGRMARAEAETRVAQLETALESRLIIEQAKGYLAGRYGLPPEDAFRELRSYARSHHLAIHDVSRRVVDGSVV